MPDDAVHLLPPPPRPPRVVKSAVAAVSFLAVSAAAIGGAEARDLFEVTVTVTPFDGGARSTEMRGFSAAEDALRVVENENLDGLFPGYGDRDGVRALIDFRGLDMTAELARDSALLIFEVPTLGIREEFGGDESGRETAIDDFVEFMKEDGGNILGRIQRKLAEVSPVDPVAGNPNSLQSRLVATQYDAGAFRVDGVRPDNRIGLRVAGGTFTADGYSGKSFTVPLSYTFEFRSDPRKKIRLQLPLAWQEVEGAQVYSVSPGLGFTFPVSDRWSLTPSVAYGLVGSVDAGSVAQMVGGMLTSAYEVPDLPMEGGSLTIGNMIGHVSTLDFELRGYGFDPDITNTVLKNGAMVDIPVGGDYSLQASYALSVFRGTKLFLNRYHELALSLGSEWKEAEFITDELRLGVTYAFGEGYRAFSVNFGYMF